MTFREWWNDAPWLEPEEEKCAEASWNAATAQRENDNLISCARCNEMKECLSIGTGFAGEHEPLCADCITAERLEDTDGGIIS